jgi:hypothetical protein
MRHPLCASRSIGTTVCLRVWDITTVQIKVKICLGFTDFLRDCLLSVQGPVALMNKRNKQCAKS